MNNKIISTFAATIILLTVVSCSNRNAEQNDITGKTKNASAENDSNTIAKNNLTTALKFVTEGLQKGDTVAFNECVDTAVTVYTGLKPSGPVKGLAEYKAIFSAFIKAWPGISFTVDESFAVYDKVVIRFNSVNVFENEFFGMKPTHEIASLKEAHIMTFKNGKIVSNVVSATNLEYEYILYPLLKDAVLASIKTKK